MKNFNGNRISILLIFIASILIIVPIAILLVRFSEIDKLAPILGPFILAGAWLALWSLIIMPGKNKK